MTTTHPSCSSQPSRLTLFIRSAEEGSSGAEASRRLISIDRPRAALVATVSVLLGQPLSLRPGTALLTR